jgi:hypothetical protein
MHSPRHSLSAGTFFLEKFIFDLSPIAVSYTSRSRRWYDYLTSVMAIIGGTFTVVGMLESTLSTAVSGRRRFK